MKANVKNRRRPANIQKAHNHNEINILQDILQEERRRIIDNLYYPLRHRNELVASEGIKNVTSENKRQYDEVAKCIQEFTLNSTTSFRDPLWYLDVMAAAAMTNLFVEEIDGRPLPSSLTFMSIYDILTDVYAEMQKNNIGLDYKSVDINYPEYIQTALPPLSDKSETVNYFIKVLTILFFYHIALKDGGISLSDYLSIYYYIGKYILYKYNSIYSEFKKTGFSDIEEFANKEYPELYLYLSAHSVCNRLITEIRSSSSVFEGSKTDIDELTDTIRDKIDKSLLLKAADMGNNFDNYIVKIRWDNPDGYYFMDLPNKLIRAGGLYRKMYADKISVRPFDFDVLVKEGNDAEFKELSDADNRLYKMLVNNRGMITDQLILCITDTINEIVLKNSVDHSIDSFKEKIAKLEEQIKNEKNNTIEYKKHCRDLRKINQKLMNDMKKYDKKRVEELNETIAKQRNEIASYKNEVTELKKELSSNNYKQEKHSGRVEKLENENRKLRDSVIELEKQLETAVATNQDLKNLITDINDTSQELVDIFTDENLEIAKSCKLTFFVPAFVRCDALRTLFPNSRFIVVDSEVYDIGRASEAVVICIKGISHSLYNNLVSQCDRYGVSYVPVNSFGTKTVFTAAVNAINKNNVH